MNAGTATIETSDQRLGRLRLFNLVMGALHTVSGGLMLALGNDFELPITTLNQNGPPGTPIDQWVLEDAVGVPLAVGTAIFLLLSAFFHFLVASPLGFPRYADELRQGRNRFR